MSSGRLKEGPGPPEGQTRNCGVGGQSRRLYGPFYEGEWLLENVTSVLRASYLTLGRKGIAKVQMFETFWPALRPS